jgi:hypothetical protein
MTDIPELCISHNNCSDKNPCPICGEVFRVMVGFDIHVEGTGGMNGYLR